MHCNVDILMWFQIECRSLLVVILSFFVFKVKKKLIATERLVKLDILVPLLLDKHYFLEKPNLVNET